jgi:hypothetical protein
MMETLKAWCDICGIDEEQREANDALDREISRMYLDGISEKERNEYFDKEQEKINERFGVWVIRFEFDNGWDNTDYLDVCEKHLTEALDTLKEMNNE